MNPSASHFNSSAATWDKPEKIAKAKEYAQVINKAIREIDSKFQIEGILEIGCGTGLLGGNFLTGQTPYTGVDASEEMLKVLKSKFPGPNVKTLNLDVEKEDLSKLDFNFVISQMAFHHLHEPATVLKKLAQKSRAKFAIIDLDQEDGTFHPDPKAMGVQHFGFSKDEISQWAQSSGLKLEHYQILDQIHKNDKTYPLFLAILG